MIKIYHNPRCSKSREALAMVEQYCRHYEMSLEIIEYMETPQTQAQLAELLEQLGAPAGTMVRENEDEYKAMGLSQADDETVLKAIAACPRLLQRPIVVYRGKAVIARPPEKLHDFLR
ncbi:arsenate reductase (glutaredoxin) [Noviherbaspirillum aerium]|uniref:arsenate reductase (glutaredoxin) n=1 Tax=Noviherbaspirillum aerium TaxID=2588497 RepID=UPI00178C4730|nr:arsenate reductase (glutaredoxin) [Noviherbaspirillum aerium]